MHDPVEGTSDPKPKDYRDRRQWQDAARARGEIPECGREACSNLVDPAWVNMGSPLLYCESCGRTINEYNPGLCRPEVVVGSDALVMAFGGDPAETFEVLRRAGVPEDRVVVLTSEEAQNAQGGNFSGIHRRPSEGPHSMPTHVWRDWSKTPDDLKSKDAPFRGTSVAMGSKVHAEIERLRAKPPSLAGLADPPRNRKERREAERLAKKGVVIFGRPKY